MLSVALTETASEKMLWTDRQVYIPIVVCLCMSVSPILIYIIFFLCPICSKCQKYSPTESSKAYDKAVSRKQGVVFDPKQVVEKIRADVTGARKVLLSKDEYIKHYLEVGLCSKTSAIYL